MPKVVAIVQARMGSSRLPNKVLMDIIGKPLLWHIVNRLRYARLIDDIIIAAANSERDNAIVDFAKENKIACYTGSENDLVDRIYKASKYSDADVIVRITADCPLVDPVLVDKVIGVFLDGEGKFDFVSNTNPRTYPDGLDVEVFSFKALERVWKEVTDLHMREMIVLNFLEHTEKYRLGKVVYKEDLSQLRWTVDYQEDFDFVKEIYKRLYQVGKPFLMGDILELLRRNHKLVLLGVRNE